MHSICKRRIRFFEIRFAFDFYLGSLSSFFPFLSVSFPVSCLSVLQHFHSEILSRLFISLMSITSNWAKANASLSTGEKLEHYTCILSWKTFALLFMLSKHTNKIGEKSCLVWKWMIQFYWVFLGSVLTIELMMFHSFHNNILQICDQSREFSKKDVSHLKKKFI